MRFSPETLRKVQIGSLAVTLALLVGTILSGQDQLARVSFEGKNYLGDPLFVSQSEIMLLGKDGRIRRLPGLRESKLENLSSRFEGYSQSELRGKLQTEFGSDYEISLTRHYVVVHPPGQSHLWPEKFEQLYTAFVHYFSVRGCQFSDPPFPLVAVVLRNRAEFDDYARRTKDEIPSNVIGYYSLRSNRIVLYDLFPVNSRSRSVGQNLETVYHEVAHQAAFNLGIHNRFNAPPRWVSEGLGTMFEARGVWDFTNHSAQLDRLNPKMLSIAKKYLSEKAEPGYLGQLVSQERIFQTDPVEAYSLAWSLSFYLSETQHANYVNFLKKTANRKPFTGYSDVEKIEDFSECFGSNLGVIEAQFSDYLKGL